MMKLVPGEELSSDSTAHPSIIEDHWIQCLRCADAFAFATTFWSAQQKLSDVEKLAKQAEASGQVLFLDREALKATLPFLCQHSTSPCVNGSVYSDSAVAIIAVEMYDIYVWCFDVNDTKPTGSHWLKALTPLPILAEKMDNDHLSTHLLTEQTFTMAELSDIGCTNVCENHYIEVGDSLFIPDIQRDMLGQAFSRYVKPSSRTPGAFCKYHRACVGKICGELERNRLRQKWPTCANLVPADASLSECGILASANAGSSQMPHAPSSRSKSDDWGVGDGDDNDDDNNNDDDDMDSIPEDKLRQEYFHLMEVNGKNEEIVAGLEREINTCRDTESQLQDELLEHTRNNSISFMSLSRQYEMVETMIDPMLDKITATRHRRQQRSHAAAA